MNKILYKFRWNCGRSGDVDGIFVSTKEEVEKNIGESIYLGEILGKHSEICGALEESDLKILTEDQDFIEKAISYGVSEIGYNPLHYLH